MDKYVKPDWEHTALLTIDTQNDFSLPEAVAEITGTYEIIHNMVSLLNTCRKNNVPIIHVIRIYKEDGSNADICRKEIIESVKSMAVPYTEGVELVKEIKPPSINTIKYDELLKGEIQSISSNEWIMYKPRWGAFYQTNLEMFLRNLKVNTIVFTGCNFPNCPRTSIYEASERDFRIVFIEDAVSGIYKKGVDELKNIGVNVLFTRQFINQITVLE